MSGQTDLSLRLLQHYDFCPSELRGDLSHLKAEPDSIIKTTISTITSVYWLPGIGLSTLHILAHLVSQHFNKGHFIFLILEVRKLRQGG